MANNICPRCQKRIVGPVTWKTDNGMSFTFPADYSEDEVVEIIESTTIEFGAKHYVFNPDTNALASIQ